MKMNAIKKLGRASVLAAVFAASAMPALAQQAEGRGTDGARQYTSLTHEIGALGDINAEIARTIHTAQINGEKVDQDAIKELRATLKQGMETTAPKIVLASGLSAQDVQLLLDQFKQQVGPLPDYLAKVNGKAKLVRVCQEYLVTPDNAVDKEHAVEVANCVASKQVVDPTPVVPSQPVESQPVTPPPVEQPAPVNTAPVDTTPAPQMTVPANHKLLVEIGGGAAVLSLGAGLTAVFLRRRKKPSDATPMQEPAAVAPPPPPPQPPKEEAQVQPAAKAPVEGDDTGPAKKPRKFEI